MDGLKNMGNTQGDSEVVDIVLNTVLNRLNLKSWDYQNVVASLIIGYSSDMRVKELAKRELSERDSSYTAIALVYGGDEEIRKKLIEMACPLPVRLRTIITTYLGESSGDETFVMSLLKLYDHEQDREVKTQASISYHERLKTSGQDTRPAIESLSESIVCYGPDHEERRQAAFCGLVILDRLDVMVSAKERIGSDRLWMIDDRKLLFSSESQFSKNKENCKFFYFISLIEYRKREKVKRTARNDGDISKRMGNVQHITRFFTNN